MFTYSDLLFANTVLRLGSVLCTIEAIEEYLGMKLSLEDVRKVEEAFMKIPEQCLGGNNFNPYIDMKGGVTLASYPVWRALWTMERLQGRSYVLKPSGVSGAVETSDGKFVALKRASNNDQNKGQLGCVAGFMRAVFNTRGLTTLGELAVRCFTNEICGEIGAKPGEIANVELHAKLTLSDQEEYLMSAKLTISSDELLARRGTERVNHVAERDIFFLDPPQLEVLLLDPEVRGAPQHLAALAIPFQKKSIGAWERLLKAAEAAGNAGEPNEGLEAILGRLGIPYEFER